MGRRTGSTLANEIKNIVYRRADGYCEVCRVGKGKEYHHILPVCYGGKDEVENIALLCCGCHYFAPDSVEEYNLYRKKGGIFWQAFDSGWKAARSLDISLWQVKRKCLKLFRKSLSQKKKEAVDLLDRRLKNDLL